MSNKYLIISKRKENDEGFVCFRTFEDTPVVGMEHGKNKQDAFDTFSSIVETLDDVKLDINHFNIFSPAEIDDIKTYS